MDRLQFTSDTTAEVTHKTTDFGVQLECEPMDCGDYCTSCVSESNDYSVFIEGGGKTATFTAVHIKKPIQLMCKIIK